MTSENSGAAVSAAPNPPKHVAIVAFGGTSQFYLNAAKQHGDRRRFADEVWAINAMGSVLNCDLVFPYGRYPHSGIAGRRRS
jgi:hypothetical protein